ncbi:MAG: hypothetical protein JRG95_05025 [Deltaproteobacteria bacterium]|nr:hypothetical protein [Deltaproteobacteria bacterium]
MLRGTSWVGRGVGSTLAATLLVLALGGVPAMGAPILDQDATGSPGSALWDDNDSTLAQVFTVGVDGQLSAVEITLEVVPDTGFHFFVAPFNLAFDPITNPVLTGTDFGSVFFPDTTATGTTLIDLSSLAITVQVGDMLVFFAEHDDVFSVAGASGYSGGDAYFDCQIDGCVDPLGPPGFIAPTSWFAVDEAGVGIRNVAFRTFVVPEPGFAMLAGLALMALRTRR